MREQKLFSNGLGHMMANPTIYGKNPLKIFLSKTRRLMTLGPVCSIGDVGPTKFVQMMILG